MRLQEIWQAAASTFKRDNPLTPKFILWYVIAIIFIIIFIVASQVIPMLQETNRLNTQIQEGKVYISGQNPVLNPDIDDFILQDDGSINLEPQYLLRKPKEHWSSAEVQEYWDDIDQKKLKELRQENQRILQEQLKDLP